MMVFCYNHHTQTDRDKAMFKKAIIVAVASLIVGCSANGVKQSVDAKAAVGGLQNYNVVEDHNVSANGKSLPVVVFLKKTETIVVENGSKFKDTNSDYGSGIQWNEEYVVTAKHVNFVENTLFKCEEGCEIQFVKHKATGPVPVWRNLVAHEPLTFVGIDQTNKLRAESGKDLDVQVFTKSNSVVKVNLANNITVGGMSGGPAYGSDGKVVGMLTGGIYTSNRPELKAFGDDLSAFLSYDVIDKEWNKYQQRNYMNK
jgi:hypothetical protein